MIALSRRFSLKIALYIINMLISLGGISNNYGETFRKQKMR